MSFGPFEVLTQYGVLGFAVLALGYLCWMFLNKLLKSEEDLKARVEELEGDYRDELEKKLEETKKNIYKNLTAWQRVQLSRHPNRPYTLDYINAICGDTFLELFGDRGFKDDKAMIGGLGKIDGQSFMIIGQQKYQFGFRNPKYKLWLVYLLILKASTLKLMLD